MSETQLAGARVLVTRPAHQAGPLAQRITKAGGMPVLLPAIEIAEPSDRGTLDRALAAAARASHAIFVSRNAVERGVPALRARGIPPALQFAAVGAATARALEAAGIHDVLRPAQRFDSEALLELLPAEAVRGRTVLLFRGEHGRELLADTLAARGAQIEAAICYRRVRPVRPDPAVLAQLARGEIDAAIVTSVDGLENLVALAGAAGREPLIHTALIVASARVAAAGRALGFRAAIEVAAGAGDDALLDALGAWQASQKNL